MNYYSYLCTKNLYGMTKNLVETNKLSEKTINCVFGLLDKNS